MIHVLRGVRHYLDLQNREGIECRHVSAQHATTSASLCRIGQQMTMNTGQDSTTWTLWLGPVPGGVGPQSCMSGRPSVCHQLGSSIQMFHSYKLCCPQGYLSELKSDCRACPETYLSSSAITVSETAAICVIAQAYEVHTGFPLRI